ncbi:MAG: glucose/arabinose dehydrogenase [Verrucomicrobiales bacterium]
MLDKIVRRFLIFIFAFFAASSSWSADDELPLPERLRSVGGVETSRVIGRPDPPLPFTVEPVLPDFPIPRLITFRFEPGTGRMIYVVQAEGEKGTRLRRYDFETGTAETLLMGDEFVYGMTLHPDFATNGFVYLGSSGPRSGERADWRALVIRYTIKPDGPIDPDSGFEIMQWPSRGHNGTALEFGSDGMLYVTSGDGTSDSDTDLTGQRLDLMLAKVMRVDVDNPAPGKAYAVPPDNPFVDHPGALPETWAYGFRNPWRAAWDPNLDRLWVGQNGQDRLEQIYLVEKGANYGWSVYEGSRIFYAERELGPTPHTPPTFEHGHNESRSLTGGCVYVGDKLPDLKNAYVYGDYATGKIWAGKHDGEKVTWHAEIADTRLGLADFVQSPDQQLLIANYQTDETGGLYRLVPRDPEPHDGTFPQKLSESGLFRSVVDHEVEPTLLPYSVNVPQWSDGASHERYVALPAEDPHFVYGARRGWDTLDGAVVLQSLKLGDRWVETRMLTRNQGEWVGYTYEWNEEQTDAELVPAEGKDREINGLTWRFESRANCMVCHSRSANYLIGLRTGQLNRDHDYGGGFVANQLAVIDQLGLFRKKGDPPGSPSPLRKPPTELERLVDPFNPDEDLNLRARAFLHVNCAHCHVESGGGNSMINLSEFVKPEAMRIFNEPPNHGTAGLAEGAKIVDPGAPGSSVLFHRVSSAGKTQMPPMGQTAPDPRAIPLLIQWISSIQDEFAEDEE